MLTHLQEVELLDSLGMLKDGASIMKKESKDVEKINALDRQFQGLGLNEMTPLKSDSSEFLELKNYLIVSTCIRETIIKKSVTITDCVTRKRAVIHTT